MKVAAVLQGSYIFIVAQKSPWATLLEDQKNFQWFYKNLSRACSGSPQADENLVTQAEDEEENAASCQQVLVLAEGQL